MVEINKLFNHWFNFFRIFGKSKPLQMKRLQYILAFSILFLTFSCGTRKVEKSFTKEDVKTEQSTTQKNDVTTNKETNVVLNDEASEIEVTPIDTSKDLVINGKVFKNAKVKILNRKSQSAITAKETVKDNSVKTAKTSAVRNNRTVQKQLERKSNPFLPLLWLLIPAFLYLVYKYKNKITGL